MAVLSVVYGRVEIYTEECFVPSTTRGSSAGATTASRHVSRGSSAGATTNSKHFPYQFHSQYPFGGLGDAEDERIDDSSFSKGY